MATQASDWAGPRLRMALAAGSRSMEATDITKGHALKLFHSALLDGDEQTTNGQFRNACGSYQFALQLALKGQFMDLEKLMDLFSCYIENLLRIQNWPEALGACEQCIQINPQFLKGYRLMSKAWKGADNQVFAAGALLRGMTECVLSSDDQVDFIVDLSILLAKLKRSLNEGQLLGFDLIGFLHFLPPLPQLPAIWTRILARLLKDKQFAPVAYLTVGLFDTLQPISRLERTCPFEVDCSSVHVEEMYEALTLKEIRDWGDELALYLVGHKAGMGKRTSDPLGVHLIKLALKYKTTRLFRHTLETQACDLIDPDRVDSNGDTALHVVVKSPPFTAIHYEVAGLLIQYGALPNKRDRVGKMPHEHVPSQYQKTTLYQRLTAALKEPEEGFRKRIDYLKKEGNQAFKVKDITRSQWFYQHAIETLTSSPYHLPRELAVLYNNMAAVEASLSDQENAYLMANLSSETDPTYHKPFWRLGKSLLEKKQFREACDKFLHGLKCFENDDDQKICFIQELCCLLPSLSDKERGNVIKELLSHLSTCWPKIIETLSKNSSWDTIRYLVLGPPEKLVDRSAVPAGWTFADRYKEGQQVKVGYAMCLRASTPDLSTLFEAVEYQQLTDPNAWVTDLVLALVLQGAQLQSLVSGDEETCYHIALSLCCLTEKLGLMRYILSEETYCKDARIAVNREKRTLLHTTCLYFGDGSHAVGRQLVQLLLEKGFDPAAIDVLSKKAVDYVAPQSPISRMLLNPSGPQPKTAEEMKDCGNAEFKKGNYRSAVDYYSQAISTLQRKLPTNVLQVKGHESKKHELAVLFSNRAECHLKLHNTEAAFADAKDSVAYDGHWYRGHVRVGRALIVRNKPQQAVKAFSNAFNALGMDTTEVQKKEILKELVKTITANTAQPPPRIPSLGYVSYDLWSKVAYDFFCCGNAYSAKHGPDSSNPDWTAGKYAFHLFTEANKTQSAHLPNIQLNLQPLCTWQATREILEPTVELILFFLACGSDHHTLSFYPGDTYIHAAAIFAVLNANSGLLDWLMKFRVKPCKEENLQDVDGNTALHLFAMPFSRHIPPPPLHPNLRRDLCKILADWGVNPLVRNKQGLLAIECLGKEDKIILGVLEEAMKKASPVPPTKAKEKPKPQPDHPQPASNNQPQKPAPSRAGNSSQPPMTERKPTDTKKMQCDQCEANINDAKNFFQKEAKSGFAYSKLVNVLSYKHQNDFRHSKLVDEALSLIVNQLGSSLSPEVPDSLLRISQLHLQQVLEKLAALNKWRQVEVVVNKARTNDIPRGAFATSMSVLALLRDKGLCGAEAQRLQILNMLMNHGARLPNEHSKDALKAVLQHGEFRVVERLFDLGLVEPNLLSLEEGDTPLHAALSVALDKESGNNFNLLELFFSLFEKDPVRYPYLNPGCSDINANTLLHLASRARYSKYSHKAVEMLIAKDIRTDVKNKDGKMAINYLHAHDRRTQYLRVAGKQNSLTMNKNEVTTGQTSTSVSPEASNDDSATVTEDARKTAEKKAYIDQQGFRTKEAVELLTELVEKLSDLTPAEAKLAKAAKGKWLETEKAPRRASIADSEDENSEETTSTASGGAQEVDNEDEEDNVAEEELEEKPEEAAELDLTFENLEWEVECTAEVWKTLRDQRITLDLKQRIVRSIRFLASGEWRPQLCWKVHKVPDSINLYQAKFVKGGRILWEVAITFSPRLSEAAEKRIEEEKKGEFAVCGGRMYTEIIRVWDIVFQYDKLRPAIKRIIQSHERGEHCLIRKELKGVKSQQFQGGLSKRYPMLYSELDVSESVRLALQSEEERKMKLYPPASASEMEFHILKFYCFSSALVYNVLKNLDLKIDFPFRVTDREHAVINLQSQAPILLLGRSGTGKTTCCLYRLWSRFLTYWTKAKEMDYEPWLPQTVQYIVQDLTDKKDEEDTNLDLFDGLLDENDNDDNNGATASQFDYHAVKKTQGRDYSAADANEEEECEEDDDFEMSHVQYNHLHQLFVTKNQVLCSEVQKNFRELCHADDVAQHHVEMEETALPHRLQDVDEYKFPLFLTSRQLILMLDASLPAPHFFERSDDGGLRVIIQGWGADEEIFAFVPLEDDSDEEEDGDYFEEDEEGEGRRVEDQAAADHRPKKKDSRREVTYEVFAHEIWPKITKKAQVNYHPSLVWTEILSFIKGSFASLAQDKGYLDKESYQQLGRKQAPNFTANRDKVYELFVKYNHYKRQHGLYDEADLVFNIYQRLKSAGHLPWILHEVFVDETQDFTQAELTVLIRLAHNPNDMFLTGDTAQSIMRGVSFRFSDLKTLFHYAKQSLKARGKTGMLEVPKHLYQLTHNYRSHAGILSLASAVLDLLVEFFPESFDRLEKDQGLFEGPQPVVLESGSPADLAILLSGNKRKTSHIEFGAHQVILVVNEEARNSLPEELSLGLVLTIYEAKGLEFDDVLLYNFFKDSQASKEWRVVTDFLERLSKADTSANSASCGLIAIDEDVLQQKGRPRPLSFNANEHKILNSELKHLYTAITRARVNVWIFDQDAEKRAPMFEYIKARKLVKFISMQDGENKQGLSQSMFAEKSSPEEWEKRGDEIMLRSLYDVAAKCYAMAGATHKQNIAIAHQKALKASHLRTQPRQMRDEFLKAAILFLKCHLKLTPSSSTLALRFNLVTKAGRCLQNARENYLAAMVFEKNGQLEIAGSLYLRARKWIAASQCFEHVDNFGRALKILDEQEFYDQAIDCLQRYKLRKQDLEKKGLPLPKALIDHKPETSLTVENFSYKAAQFYHRHNDIRKMLASIERLPNKDDQISFLQTHGCLQEAAKLLCSDGRVTEAARMMLHNGQVDSAIMIAEEGADNSLKAQCYYLKAQQLRYKSKKSATKAKAGEGTAENPESTKKSKQKASELLSSDEEENNSDVPTQQQIIDLLERAFQQYDLSNNHSGMGECRLMLAEIRQNRDLLEDAFKLFKIAQPVSNITGMLECVQALYSMKAGSDVDTTICGKLIWGVENVYDVVRVLLCPSTVEEKNRYQTYLTFYGLEQSAEGKLVLHPKLKPRCTCMISSKHLYTTKEEKKEERLYRAAKEVCNYLANFLIRRIKDWCEKVDIFLENQLPQVIQCQSFKEGHSCEDMKFCPYLHGGYTQELTDKALTILCSKVRLDRALQSGAEVLTKIDLELADLTLSLTKVEEVWNSVENLLEFLFPAGLLTYNMSSVITFCICVSQKNPLAAGIHYQIQRYLQYLWDNPGRVGKGKSSNVLKERCKSTNWIVLASLLAPLFKLDLKVDDICQKLELEINEKQPNWIRKRHKYALVLGDGVTISLARRHLDALQYLKPDKFDPVEALIKFTKFVKMLFDRGEVSLMPDLHVFLFWMEFFTTVALCLAPRIRGNGHLFLPDCYTRILKLFNLTLPQAHKGDLMKFLEEYQFSKKQTLILLQQRIENLVWILCGQGASSFSFMKYLIHLKDKSTSCLLLERTLVLSLTLLINIEQDNVFFRCEQPILQSIKAIPEHKIQDMPPRLAALIDRVQEATTYQNIIEALRTTLSEMDERSHFYQWRRNKQTKDPLLPAALNAVRAGSLFRSLQSKGFEPHADSYQGTDIGVGLYEFADEVVEPDLDVLIAEEEEEEISPEENEHYQQLMAQAQKEERQKKAATTLQKFFRLIRFHKRLRGLKRYCVPQMEQELFSPFIAADRMCGICGVSFEKTPGAAKSATEGEDTESGAKLNEEEEEEENEETVVARQKEIHMNSKEHQKMQTEYGTFREIYRKSICFPLNEAGVFLSKHQVKKMKTEWYKAIPFVVDSILQKVEHLHQQLNSTIQDRRWTEGNGLVKLTHELVNFLQGVHRQIIENYIKNQEQEKQMEASWEAETQHNVRMMEGMVEDPALSEILDVVDEPQGPNALGGGRVYRGGGRGRGGGWRGRGMGGGRGRGGDHFLRREMHGGPRNPDYIEAQFEKGDLPPRFRRNQPH